MIQEIFNRTIKFLFILFVSLGTLVLVGEMIKSNQSQEDNHIANEPLKEQWCISKGGTFYGTNDLGNDYCKIDGVLNVIRYTPEFGVYLK